jgi:hypothetical protein
MKGSARLACPLEVSMRAEKRKVDLECIDVAPSYAKSCAVVARETLRPRRSTAAEIQRRTGEVGAAYTALSRRKVPRPSEPIGVPSLDSYRASSRLLGMSREVLRRDRHTSWVGASWLPLG